jgi:hypothetical protein
MVQVKRNSTEFKDVRSILEEYENKPTRKRLIKLYAIKPTEKIEDMILINTLKQNADVLYNMQYATILEYFWDKAEKLYREDKKMIYYFKSSPGSDWIKVPFEFTGKLKKELFPLRVIR